MEDDIPNLNMDRWNAAMSEIQQIPSVLLCRETTVGMLLFPGIDGIALGIHFRGHVPGEQSDHDFTGIIADGTEQIGALIEDLVRSILTKEQSDAICKAMSVLAFANTEGQVYPQMMQDAIDDGIVSEESLLRSLNPEGDEHDDQD